MTDLPVPVQNKFKELFLTFVLYIAIGGVGYYWGYSVTQSTTNKRYKFKAFSATGAKLSAFYCDCPKLTKAWMGSGNNNECGNNNLTNDKAMKLVDFDLPKPPSPGVAGAYACCIGNPKIIKVTATGIKSTHNLKGTTCW